MSKLAKNVPVVIQLEALECGAACLTMLMAYYKKWVPLEQVRKDCGVSRDGSSAANVLKAARSYGFEADAYKVEPEDLVNETDDIFPCIIHWNFNHFVVLDGFKKGFAYLNDPARGEVKVTMKEFDEAFTGVTLIIKPGEKFVPSGKPKSVWSFVKKRMSGAKIAIAFVVITTVISNLLGLIRPGFSRIFLDRLLTGLNPEWVDPFIMAFLGLSVLQLAINWITVIYSNKINGKMAVVGSTSYMWKVLRMPIEFFSQRDSGDILSRESENASIANSIVNTFAPMVLNGAMAIFYFVVMIRYSVVLTCVGLFSIVFNMLVNRYSIKKRNNLSRISMRDSSKLSSTMVSGIEMIESIKSSGAENGYFEKLSGYQAAVADNSVKQEQLSYATSLVPSVFNTICTLTIEGIALYLVMHGEFTLGKYTAFEGYLSSFTSPMTTIINAGNTLQGMKVQMERIEDVMDYPLDPMLEEKPEDENQSYAKLSGNIEMNHIVFGYSPLAAPLIEDFNMKIKPGQKIAFVGQSGCGKSTITKLLSGLYEPWSGEILFDGKPIKTIDRNVFVGSVAVVDQDITLFEDSINNNIKMWDNTIENFEVIMAARDAHIHTDILEKEGGYNHKLIEGGKDFSGGQRQRLEIARVLAQDPTIVILDEATSALDAQTEYEVIKSIKERGITCIVIAHRLSTIRDADEIVVLDNGHVVERGKHEDLIKQDGYYTKLVTSD